MAGLMKMSEVETITELSQGQEVDTSISPVSGQAMELTNYYLCVGWRSKEAFKEILSTLALP